MESYNEKNEKYALYNKTYNKTYYKKYYREHKDSIYLKQKEEHNEFREYVYSLSDKEFLEVIGFKDPKEQLKLPKIFKDDDEE